MKPSFSIPSLPVLALLACSSDPAATSPDNAEPTPNPGPSVAPETSGGPSAAPPGAPTPGPVVVPPMMGDTEPVLEGGDTEVQSTCGDGALDEDEACDDGNQADGDGCPAHCRFVEKGFVCKPSEDNTPQSCIPFARCGDALFAFPEQCDDGNEADGDGCDATCKLELGFKCDGEPSQCSPTECGDGVVEGTELCEPDVDAGCTSQCVFAPDCTGDGPCTSACGDGIILGEPCDDGNILPGDGCDETCQIEPGYSCELRTIECERSESTDECILRVPVTYRDFDASHSDFESDCAGSGATLGLVEPALVDKKPVPTGTEMCTTGFADWYQASDSSTAYATELVLYDDGEGNYVNRYGANGEAWFTTVGTYDGTDCTVAPHCGPFYGSPFFFPVDGIEGARGDEASIAEVATMEYGLDGSLYSELDLTGEGPLHNFSFTSEVEYWFPYDEATNATLQFTGDDDVWVFINGQLALDLGGMHSAIGDQVTVSGMSDVFVGGTEAAHQMTPGNVYPVKVFHAERHTTGSTFRLTLSGFSPTRSACTGECGNGSVEHGEECDDGELNKDEYNHCGTDCRLTEYCGDGLVTDGEACDDARDADCHGCRKPVVR